MILVVVTIPVLLHDFCAHRAIDSVKFSSSFCAEQLPSFALPFNPTTS